MDAKTTNNFTNAVAGNTELVCPSCGAPNEADARFCEKCGTPIPTVSMPTVAPAEETPASVPDFTPAEGMPVSAPAFAPAEETPASTPAFAPAEDAPAPVPAFASVEETSEKKPEKVPVMVPVVGAVDILEEPSVFAEGLPSWTIEPPQVMVRRKNSK